ncbi:protein suex-1-like [Polyergus mexicanus]|uniref:protein suex-1-like n=1 Tax=Polyergus mexicanus TaxID=615972 RepID=UPI0038B43B78
MIKLFLITLLCATLVFADSPVQDLQDAWEKPVNGFSMADHLRGRDSSLVRRSAQGGGREFGGVGGEGAGGAGGGFGGGFGGRFGGHIGWEAGAGAGGQGGGGAEGQGGDEGK